MGAALRCVTSLKGSQLPLQLACPQAPPQTVCSHISGEDTAYKRQFA